MLVLLGRVSRKLPLLALVSVLLTIPAARAEESKAVSQPTRTRTQDSMREFLKARTVEGILWLYDPVENKIRRLEPRGLHESVEKKSGFYVSCADYVDPSGRKFDVDILVQPSRRGFVTTQAVIHAVDGKKRPYELESP